MTLNPLIEATTGKVLVTLDGAKHKFEDEWVVVIPAGTKHCVVNVGYEPVRLYSIYHRQPAG